MSALITGSPLLHDRNLSDCVVLVFRHCHSDSLLLCHPRLGTQKKRRRTCDAIIFSCNRVNEFQSREDDMICACTTKGNCALPNDCSMTQNKIAVQRHMGQMKCCSALVIGSLLPTTRASHTSEWSPDSNRWFQTCPVSCKHFNTLPTQHPSQTCEKQFNVVSLAVSDSRFARRTS